ncbi:MAG: Lrp/AsnC family transcriptional regulator, partial [Neisseriaceae bacterium]|nr:Lrp/AsnC family transcriptional regulator [Neisseriaceae bacterium]
MSKDSGVPEKTVARRIKKLMDTQVLRVVGEYDPLMLKKGVVVHVWLECELGTAESVGQQLASFVDSRLVVALSGEYDLMAEFYFDDIEQLLALTVTTLPHVVGIRNFDVSMVLQSFKRASQWQMAAMLPERLKMTLSVQERQLVGLLMEDGRANLNVLATHLDVSEPTAFRMMQTLTESGVLRFRVDIEPKLMGYAAEAIVCLEVNPNHLTTVAQTLSKHPNTRCLFGTSGRSQLFWHVLCE